jgi:hypothetical protein
LATEPEPDGERRREERDRFPRVTAGQDLLSSCSFVVGASEVGAGVLLHGGVHPARSPARSEQMMPAASSTATAPSAMAPPEARPTSSCRKGERRRGGRRGRERGMVEWK